MIESEGEKLNNERSQKILKCLSDKYIKNRNWDTNRSIVPTKKEEVKPKRSGKMRCERFEDDDEPATYLAFNDEVE